VSVAPSCCGPSVCPWFWRAPSTLYLSRRVRPGSFTLAYAGLFTASSDKSVKCLDASGTLIWSQPAAHDAAANVVCPLAEHLIASGDEDGVIKIWDTRLAGDAAASTSALAAATSAAASTAVTFKKQKDVITDMQCIVDKATLLATAGDGTLGVYDLRKMRMAARSEPTEDELLSCAVIKGGSAVVTGTQEGVLLVWDWGKWTWTEADEDTGVYGPERFKGHPQSIDALLVVDDDTIVTGSSDGLIRLLTVRPNKLVGILGEHSDFPIETLAWSRDRKYIASASHDNMIKFWDVGYLFEDDDDDEDDDGSAGKAAPRGKAGAGAGGGVAHAGAGAGAGAAGGKGSKFTAMPELALPHADDDSDEEDEDSEDEDDEDEDEDEEEDSDAAGAGAPAHAGAGAAAGAGAGARRRRGMEEDDSLDPHRSAGAAVSAGTKGAGAGAGRSAAAAVDEDEDDDDDDDEGGGGSSRRRTKAKQKGKGGKGGKGGRGFFADL